MYTLVNQVSVKPLNCNVGYVNSWLSVLNNAQREFCAQAAYITNFDDMMLTLSAGNVNIGAVEIKDWNSNLRADVISDGGYNALRVLSQDLESSVDDITIGDRDGNFAKVNVDHSALNVYFTNISALATNQSQETTNSLLNSLTSLNQREFNETQTLLSGLTSLNEKEFNETQNLLNSLTSLQNVKQNQIITILNNLTSNTDGLESLLHNLTAIQFNILQNSKNTLTYFEYLSTFNYDVTITNPEVTVLNPVTAVQVLNPEVTILNPVTAVNISNNTLKDVNFDAFNRLRISNPVTLFDSSHRYSDNDLWTHVPLVGGVPTFNSAEGAVDLITTNNNGYTLRQTKKVFSYQPGKSLLVLNTFTLSPSANGLLQRVGYYNENNGIFFQQKDDKISIVKRTSVSGLPQQFDVLQSEWNGDKLDGTGESGIVLDPTKSQIFWIDIEWLGVGTVRTGFVIDGKFILCHSFHHANTIEKTYMTTASLPVTYEIENSTSQNNLILKQICTSVISEGGYELKGKQKSIVTPITAPYSLATSGVYYPVISLRLDSNRIDAIVVLTSLKLMGIGNGINYGWRIVSGGSSTGGSWVSAGTDSSVEYNISGTSYSGGSVLTNGFLNSSNQGSPTIQIPRDDLFKFQLERVFESTGNLLPSELTLLVTSSTNSNQIFASMDWEEITR